MYKYYHNNNNDTRRQTCWLMGQGDIVTASSHITRESETLHLVFLSLLSFMYVMSRYCPVLKCTSHITDPMQIESRIQSTNWIRDNETNLSNLYFDHTESSGKWSGKETEASNSIKSREKVFLQLVFRHPQGLRFSEL